jgi:hypothetical protein
MVSETANAQSGTNKAGSAIETRSAHPGDGRTVFAPCCFRRLGLLWDARQFLSRWVLDGLEVAT